MDNIRIKPVWSKSKEDIWNELFEPLEEHGNENSQPVDEQKHKKGFLRRIPLWGYAASILLPVLLMCRLYTVTEVTLKGEHSVVMLPDHSTVTVNVDSKVSYKPFWWYVSRKITLQGEAYFEVKPGSLFCVQSGQHRVNVLGTTFNVYARSAIYRVTCISGRVEVQTGKESAILNPNMQAVFDDRRLSIYNNVTPLIATGWMQGMFVFIETPLQEVIAEIERRYNITVAPDYNPDRLYSGTFAKTEYPEEALEIIGKALEIRFFIK
jgi:ferric-dicitrate binding protein FerR (iron transport regulator)